MCIDMSSMDQAEMVVKPEPVIINFEELCTHPQLLRVLPELLRDRTTGNNITWATDAYANCGRLYGYQQQMTFDSVMNIWGTEFKPRVLKSIEAQLLRTKDKAEVFTPSWICNKMNNYCDEQWFMQKGVFNTESEDGHTWEPSESVKEAFRYEKDWQKYVDSRRIEITCGEAPYLVSRYDTTTGEMLPLEKRIGMLDRKLRVVTEKAKDKEWFKWAVRAYESTYGYEYQGDNLLLARINLFLTFLDYYTAKFGCEPTNVMIDAIVKVITWNIWQMDGLRDCVPVQPQKDTSMIGCDISNTHSEHDKCKVKNWRAGSKGCGVNILFEKLKREVD